MRSANFSYRFVQLTVLGYLVAVITVALAVWLASRPALETMQNEARTTYIKTRAALVSDLLDNLADEARYLAQHPGVTSLTIGETSRAREVRDLFSRRGDLLKTRLYDYSGRKVLEVNGSGFVSPFYDWAALPGFAEMVEGRRPPEVSIQYLPGANRNDAFFLIVMPVISQGLVEGFVTIETRLDLTSTLQPSQNAVQSLLLTPFQRSLWSSWYETDEGFDVTPVPNTEFFIAIDSDNATLELVGRELVVKAICVAILALLLPFILMGASGLRAIVRPHEELQKSQLILRQKQDALTELAQIAEMASECIIVTSADVRIIWVNAAFEKLTGYTRAEAIGCNPKELLQGPDTDPKTVACIAQALARREPVDVEICNYTKNKTSYWINLSISPLVSNSDGTLRFTSISRDITASKQALIDLERAKSDKEYQALHDPLTNLPNRRKIDAILSSEVTNANAPRTLIRIDLDHFKNVNDTLGHAAGDFVLCEVARILQETTTADYLCARVGGDEFVILCPAETNETGARALAETIGRKVRVEMLFEGQSCRIGASFGIASAHTDVVTNEELLKSADSALYLAKEAGRNTTVIYSPAVHLQVNAKRKLSKEIEAGIERQEFEAHFQPQFDARNEELVGVEALVRWHHPTRGILTPAQFLPVAEQLKIVPKIDQQVFQFGCDRIAELNNSGFFIPKVSFNVGIKQLMDPNLIAVALSKDVGWTRISFEILESVLVEELEDDFMERVNELRRNDFSIEIDDFGTGHASVIGLQRLVPDTMKLDQELVKPIDKCATARVLVKSMIDIGKALGVSVTAEGIETAEHATIMKELGCDTLQGYFFARPMHFEQLRKFVQDGYDEKLSKITSFAVRKHVAR